MFEILRFFIQYLISSYDKYMKKIIEFVDIRNQDMLRRYG